MKIVQVSIINLWLFKYNLEPPRRNNALVMNEIFSLFLLNLKIIDLIFLSILEFPFNKGRNDCGSGLHKHVI